MNCFHIKFLVIIKIIFILINVVCSEIDNLPKIRQQDGKVCIGDQCIDDKQMAEMQTFLKPLFEKMYNKVFKNNPKFKDLQNMPPDAIAADTKLNEEIQRELMKAAYEELKDKDINEVMKAMSHLKIDENVNAVKRELKKTFDEYDADGNGVISYMDVADILKENLKAGDEIGDDDDDDSLSEGEINALIHEIDKDKSGNINFKEFKELFPKVHKKQLYRTPTQKEPKHGKKVSKKLTKEEL
ncbi:probable calcium-binding protein CML23 [Chrysoperla carnea]|uniref:probable calcium-binding protein CML23 n=1 Tax=Chrysoperla carnea TaxID=189513 RepID=UPI001D08CC2E|nr:probable calcium-binding protein CML23 [Chrysoperla carnea]